MELSQQLGRWFENKPLVLLRMPDGVRETLLATKRAVNQFSFVRSHHVFQGLKLPTLCLVEMKEGRHNYCYVGVVRSKSAVATFDSRLMVAKLRLLNLPSLDSLKKNLHTTKFQRALATTLNMAVTYQPVSLTPKLSLAITEELSKDPQNLKAIETASFGIAGLRRMSNQLWEQLDCVRMALSTLGLNKSAVAKLIELEPESDSTLQYVDSEDASVLEDNIIAKDASVVPGFTLIRKYVTGLAIFDNREDRLQVYTANRGPLEKMFGVDLIYINEKAGNTVMVQYKMLSSNRSKNTGQEDWRTWQDPQLLEELSRMKLPTLSRTVDDYRLHRDPFFFKFVKKRGDGDSHHAFIISLDHLKYLLAANRRGPKGGIRVSYQDLGGIYLRESDFVSLIRSGYIGTHRRESGVLEPIISEVAKGNRGLVLAWQRQMEREEFQRSHGFFDEETDM